MPRNMAIWIVVLLVVGVALVWLACGGDKPAEPGSTNYADTYHSVQYDSVTAIVVAAQAKSTLGIPSTSVAYFTSSPVDTGYHYVEDLTDSIPVALWVPSTPAVGDYYMFYIDDHPSARFGHPVRYAWVDFDPVTQTILSYNVVGASCWPVLLDGDASFEPGPFEMRGHFEVSGTWFFAGEKGGVGRRAESSQGGGTRFEQRPTPAPGASPGTVAPTYDALVLDGGDERAAWGWRMFWGATLSELSTLADEFARDADSVAGWLKNQGFTIYRRSQYWGNEHPKYQREGGQKRGNALRLDLKNWATWYQNNPPDSGSHEFFLYIGAHGFDTGTFSIFSQNGTGDGDFVDYKELQAWLNEFPTYVKIIVFIDTCYSGAALTKEVDLRKLCDNDRKATIITSTDEAHVGEGGQGVVDSGTEDFMDGASTDHDGDGKKGDFFDRWREMEIQGAEFGPKRHLCTANQPMCSTD